MYAFWNYWYRQSWLRFYTSCRGAIQSIEDQVAVVDTARNISKPLFQDYTWQGRILGFFLRLFRILAGLLSFGAVIIGYVLIYLFWLVLPPLCLLGLVGSFLGGTT